MSVTHNFLCTSGDVDDVPLPPPVFFAPLRFSSYRLRSSADRSENRSDDAELLDEELVELVRRARRFALLLCPLPAVGESRRRRPSVDLSTSR